MPLRIPLDISGKSDTQPSPDFLLEYQFQNKNREQCPECFGLGKVMCDMCHGEGKLWSNHIPFWRMVGVHYFRCMVCLHTPGRAKCLRCNGTGLPPKVREPIREVISRNLQWMFLTRERRLGKSLEVDAEQYADERKRVRDEFKARLRMLAEESARNKGAPVFRHARTGPVLEEIERLRVELAEEQAAAAAAKAERKRAAERGSLGRIFSTLIERPARPSRPARRPAPPRSPRAAGREGGP
eukprot:tig00020930_g16036.t1